MINMGSHLPEERACKFPWVRPRGSKSPFEILWTLDLEPSASEPLLKQALNLWNAFEIHTNSFEITAQAVETVLLQFQ